MEFKEVIEKRRTIRDFQDKEVSNQILSYAIENAFKAPSYNHMREWDFLLLKSMESKLKLIQAENIQEEIDIIELTKLFENEDIIKKEMYLDAIPKQKKMILQAPIIVVVIFKPKTRIEKAQTVYDLNCLASAWACIENLLLSLAEHEVYGVTFIPKHTDLLKAELKIPTELEIAAVIPIGYKSHEATILKQKPLNIRERIHTEIW